MKSFIAATFVAAVAALPAPQVATTEQSSFGGLALRSASPIHFGSINANGLGFWIHKNTSTYTEAGTIAEPTNPYTSFTLNSEVGTLGLDTVVPGGQQVYVDYSPDGQAALKFTQIHSVNTGSNGVVTGFSIVDENLLFEGAGFVACPEEDAYKIYAASRGTNDACLGFSFRTVSGGETEPVWSYSK
ncbi:uncharacterized protein RCC_10323 [Ramularia collo-cygni]|uniref:Cell wall protein PhiA n=1 Tax=Ramularia collo-cygni TaxID=112498 RepID=A0A2D3VQW1_9PEZI|nr:uncharacterized protein RCC_10323 [Ramularia collo-cygni]CZT24598.1 uncharacterized protein RCC_10323 [Ramularia collo-cygni]